MRRTLALIVSALLLQIGGSATGAHAPALTDATFWSVRDGIGLFAACSSASCSLQLRRTSDGGSSWKYSRQLPNSHNAGVRLVIAPPANVWVGQRASSDGGQTWRQLHRSPFTPISMSSRSDGWGVDATRAEAGGGRRQHLAVTTTGGRTWRVVENPCTRVSEVLDDVSTPRAAYAWVLCDGLYGAGNDAKAVFATVDSGKHWKLVNQTDFPGGRRLVGDGLTPAGYAAGITFHLNGHGWLWEARGTVYTTKDGGRNWSAVPVPWVAYGEPQSVSFPTDQAGFIVMRVYVGTRFSYRIARTENGGHTWRTVRSWQE